MINIPRSTAHSDARINGFWSRTITTRRGKKKNVRVVKVIQNCLIDVGVEDSHEQDIINDQELGDQRRYKRDMEKIMEEKGMKKA